MEKNYSIREASELLGMKVRTCRQWVRDGRIKAVKYSGSNMWRISEDEIHRVARGRDDNKN